MAKINCTRNGCKDVFHSKLLKEANYEGNLEIPVLKPCDDVPNRLIPFSKAMSTTDHDQWVHFYEDDAAFERIWNRSEIYLPILMKFRGVITPDFSLYRDMPLVMQQWNTFRGKALGHWWQTKGLNVLPNVRTADERSYEFCCSGVPHHSTICVGTHGCVKIKEEREKLKKGLRYIIQELSPSRIVFYGSVPEDIAIICKKTNIPFLSFKSEFAFSREGEAV